MKKLLVILGLLIITTTAFSQENGITIDQQFQELMDNSNSYQDFKVIKISKLNRLNDIIKDSLATLKIEIESESLEIERQKAENLALTNSLNTTESDLASSLKKEDGIEFFGIIIKKSIYNTFMVSIIVILLVILTFSILKFKSSHTITKETQSKLVEIENKFDAHRSKSLEEIQQLGRKLQDEINKNKKS